MPMHHKRHQRRKEEENTIHDPKGERRLQHIARLVRIDREGRVGDRRATDCYGIAIGIDAGVARYTTRDGTASFVRDEAEFVYSANERAHETDVDEGNEEGGSPGGVTAEEGQEGPDTGEDGHDEEDAVEEMGSVLAFSLLVMWKAYRMKLGVSWLALTKMLTK